MVSFLQYKHRFVLSEGCKNKIELIEENVKFDKNERNGWKYLNFNQALFGTISQKWPT